MIVSLPSIPDKVKRKIRSREIFVDTDFIIDYNNMPNNFAPVVDQLKALNVTFRSIPEVFIEFMNGASNLKDRDAKVDFFNGLIQGTLMSRDKAFLFFIEKTPGLPFTGVKDMDMTDFLLLASHYSTGKSLILSGNKKHMPMTFLNVVHTFPIDCGERGLKVCFLYDISATKLRHLNTKYDQERARLPLIDQNS